MKGCCFTGYRPIKMPFPMEKGNEQYEEFKRRLRAAILDAIDDGFDTFFNGAAMGLDLEAAKIIIELKSEYGLKLILALPYPGQANSYPPEWLELYREVLAAADEKFCASKNFVRSCFQVRNQYMVDQSERVITFYDGQTGGTKNTLDYAKRKNVQIVNIAE